MEIEYPDHISGPPLSLRDLSALCLHDSKHFFPEYVQDISVHTLGLVGETGEFADIVKKVSRGSMPSIRVEQNNIPRARLIEELVDVLIYVGNLAALLQVDLEKALDRKREINYDRFTG